MDRAQGVHTVKGRFRRFRQADFYLNAQRELLPSMKILWMPSRSINRIFRPKRMLRVGKFQLSFGIWFGVCDIFSDGTKPGHLCFCPDFVLILCDKRCRSWGELLDTTKNGLFIITPHKRSWKQDCENAKPLAKTSLHPMHVLLSIWLHSRRIIHFDLLPVGETKTGMEYRN